MKFKAFSNSNLNFSCMDIELVPRGQLSIFTCAACGFIAEDMFYCSCSHVFCTDCLLPLEPVKDNQKVVDSRCLLCQSTSSAMKIQIEREFVSNLKCVCPQCRTPAQLYWLKHHLRLCKALPQLGDAGQATSDSGSSQPAVSSSVAASISAVQREVVNMMSNDKNELRSEFTQKITAVLTEISSITTQLRPCRRLFRLAFRLDTNNNIWSTSNVCVDDITFAFGYSPTTNEVTATVWAIGDKHVKTFSRAHIAAAVVPNETALRETQILENGFVKKPFEEADLVVGKSIQFNLEQYGYTGADYGQRQKHSHDTFLQYALDVTVEFDWEP